MNFSNKTFTIAEALSSLCPESSWAAFGDNYEDVQWMDEDKEIPSKKQVEEEVLRLQKEWDSKKYKLQRKSEYPDFTDYLDGIVKGDQNQIDTYIAECLAVKEKYPKPS
jgi:hypothetical protein